MRFSRFVLLLLGLAAAAPVAVFAESLDLPTKLGPPVAKHKFRWPLIGKTTQSFDGEGVDILAPTGEPVHAAEDGVVMYAGDELKTYGNLVLIRHADGYVTAYAHLSEISVVSGAKLRRGDIVGKCGDTGDVASPRLHFELRKDGVSLNPKGYMAPM